MEFDGVCDLWSIWATKSSCLYRLSQGFSKDVIEAGQFNSFLHVYEKVSVHSSICQGVYSETQSIVG